MDQIKIIKPSTVAICLFLLGTTSDLLLARDLNNESLLQRMYGDRKARRVGDLLTVVIAESMTSSKDASSTTDKSFNLNGALSFSAPLIDGIPSGNTTNFSLPSYSVGTTRNFQGKGSLENKDEINATIAVRVTEVLPNGNLLIEGKRQLRVQREKVEFFVSGTVRVSDISRENTVRSTDIADASIGYLSSGSIARNQHKGLFTRVWDWLNPF